MTTNNNARKNGPTKAERARNIASKARALAAKRATGVTFESELPKFIDGQAKEGATTRIMASVLNAEFGDAVADFKCHWAHWTTANMRSDNEKALLARLKDREKSVLDAADKKGLVNPRMPWSRIKKAALDLFTDGKGAPREPRPLDKKLHEFLLRGYKAGMKEEKQTDEEARLMHEIGTLLVRFYKEDLTKY